MMLSKSQHLSEMISDVEELLFERTGGVVQSGPFKGMKLNQTKSWNGTRWAPMLLGTFEQELHWCLEQEIKRLQEMEQPKIVNVGSAEGYYAIGLAMRIPQAKVWAIDCDEKSVELSRQNALLNGVNIITDADVREAMEAPDLVVMDCEGNEVAYIDYETFPAMRKATIIVEIHDIPEKPDRPGQHTSRILFERCKDTHSITVMTEAGRIPGDLLSDINSDLRWIAVSEGRPCLMAWYLMRPK